MPIPVTPTTTAPPSPVEPVEPVEPTRGTCGSCGRTYTVNADGGLRAHDPLPAVHCPGSGHPPAAASG